jgi:putative ABC transport system permease protein
MHDVKFALRMLRQNPAFTAVLLLALALGIGATTATFSVVHSVLLKPLPFAEPNRLVMVWERPPQGKATNVVQTGNFLEWRKRNRSFENIAAIMRLPINLAGEGEPVQVPGLFVTAGFFEILGVPPVIGRTIRPEDDVPGAPRVVVLSYGLWQRRFGGRADTIGQKVRIGGRTEVIGVMPPGFEFPGMRADVYEPMQIRADQAARDGRNFSTIARVRTGVSLAMAQTDMQAIAAQTAAERPDINAKWSATVVPLLEHTVGDTRPTLYVLLGAVGFVLLIACANVSNLLLMRASKRRREILVRIALGAGRWRLLRQLTVESLLLAVSGGLLGFVLAWWGVPAIIRMLPVDFPLPRMREIAVDRGVLAFTMLVSLGCGVFFGILPALQADRARLNEGLHDGGRSGTAGNRTVRNSLVLTEVAVAVLLVIGAGLMVRSFILLNEVDPGFRPEHVLAFRMLLLNTGQDFAQVQAHRAAVIEQTLDRVRALPMVTAASSIHLLPLAGGASGTWYYRADRPTPPPGAQPGGDVSVISDGYFQTMGIPLLAGREFDARDRKGAPQVAILNQTAARMFYPDENPIGKRMKIAWGPGDNEFEIVGVARDMHHVGLQTAPDPCVFLPHPQQPSGYASLVVRTSGEPTAAVAAVKEQLRAVDPNQGIQDVQTLQSVITASTARPRLHMTVMSAFGVVALALACLGIYAVISYSVEQRTRELGIRLALGASSWSILRMVLGEAMGLAAGGIALGLAAAAALTRYLASLLYAVRPTDLGVYAGVSAVLAAAAIAGCWFPARRAISLDPNLVLREE